MLVDHFNLLKFQKVNFFNLEFQDNVRDFTQNQELICDYEIKINS